MTRSTIISWNLLLTLGILSLPAAGLAEDGPRKTFLVGKGGLLQVSVGQGDIKIISRDRNEVEVSGYDTDEAGQLTMDQQGNTIRIESGGGWSFSGDRLIVTVPPQFDLDLRTGSGNLEVEGPLSGKISGKTGGGEVVLGDLGGRITFTTSGGNITAGNTNGEVALTTSGGNIRLGKSAGQVQISTSGGEISAESVGKDLRATTSGGDVTIGDVGGSALVNTAGGDIQIGVVSGNATINTAGGNIVLRSATGTVTANTAGGDVDLQRVGGSVTATTSGGNVRATLDADRPGASKLTTAAGDIHLRVPESARVTIVAHIGGRGWWKGEDETYDVHSDFKALTYEKDERTHEIRATYQLNGGGQEIVLETAMGSIEIKKGKP